MGKVSDAIWGFVVKAEKNPELNLYTGICKALQIQDGDTSKAVFMRSKVESEMGTSPTEEQCLVLKMLYLVIEVSQMYPELKVQVNTLVELIEVLQEIKEGVTTVSNSLPEDFIQKCMHREGVSGCDMPAVYYKDGVLIAEPGSPSDEDEWLRTGCVNIYSWEVFRRFMQQFADGEPRGSQRTNAFGKSKFQKEDFLQALLMLQNAGIQIKPGLKIRLHSGKIGKTVGIEEYGKKYRVSINDKGIGSASIEEPISKSKLKVCVVCLDAA